VNRVHVLTDLGNQILLTRRRLGLTQEALAERAGISVTFCGQIERGIRNPTFLILHSIATALETTVSGLCSEIKAGPLPPQAPGRATRRNT